MPCNIPEGYMTLAMIADRMGISRQAIHKQFKKGVMPSPAARRPVSPTMFHEADIEQWLNLDLNIRDLVHGFGWWRMPGISAELLAICEATIEVLLNESRSVRERCDVAMQVLSLVGENHSFSVHDEYREQFRTLLPDVIPAKPQATWIPRRVTGLGAYGVGPNRWEAMKARMAKLVSFAPSAGANL